ncbi:uncharacterized protein BT62DRAFT_937671 [Guyanagaster necrorhizus]|uniref:Uncharacterized protein n=1 Tax=Guyanagaster necrorhizus TaxID=856835 RepID=A0A9P7VHX1_9AGAR|nr:uncharacterized protein BT62DRAFT_937671 [Guyanagaster necrorhizus MCA 3950]KAG7440888.1 hypothetical protein BT62DRAFT_937671 [Guyanagaster necrorhizus MCA 3950]
MSTIVERPPSLPLQHAPVVIPQRRLREPDVEVIDVDLWEDAPSRPAQRRRTSPDFISLLDDSDIEEIGHPAASGSNHTRRGTAAMRRLFSPPPPDPDIQVVPPVPSIPARFSMFPMRREPPPHPIATPVLARPDPFDFEVNLHSPSTPATVQNSSDTGRPHRLPRITLGGAVMSTGQARSAEVRRERERRLQAQAQGGIPRRRDPRRIQIGNGYLALDHDAHDDNTMRHLNFLLFPAELHDEYAMGDSYFRTRRNLMTHSQPPEVDYKPQYTHPGLPEPGFTFDFAPPTSESSPFTTSKSNPIVIDDDEPIASSSSGSDAALASISPPSSGLNLQATLVCANCNEGLYQSGSGSAEDQRRRRIWSLRCGHLIDGKCIDRLSVPQVPPQDVSESGKGKEKAKEGAATANAAEETNTIRSRLRSSHKANAELLQRIIPSILKRKGKAKSEVEAEHQWTCPVIGCGRVHTSVKIGGIWGPDKVKGEGIIGVFV